MAVAQSTIEENVQLALVEDVGDGDVSAGVIDANAFALATVVTREDCVICGMDWFEEVYRQIDEQVFIEWNVQDGERIAANETVCSISGLARSLLTGERTALNFLQTLSATATVAAAYADAVKGTGAIVLDTRKTIPGLRAAQKYAVTCGGCSNHRMGLYDAILLKENHIMAAGSIANAIGAARFLNPGLPVEIETETLDEVEQAVAAGADRIMLDDFSLEDMKRAVERVQRRAELEASGGVSLQNIREIADTGVDFISTGALTKDIRAIDLSMRFSA